MKASACFQGEFLPRRRLNPQSKFRVKSQIIQERVQLSEVKSSESVFLSRQKIMFVKSGAKKLALHLATSTSTCQSFLYLVFYISVCASVLSVSSKSACARQFRLSLLHQRVHVDSVCLFFISVCTSVHLVLSLVHQWWLVSSAGTVSVFSTFSVHVSASCAVSFTSVMTWQIC